MKKSLSLIMALLLAFMMVGCSTQESEDTAPVKQTASAYLDQDGTTVTVTVDLSNGWSCEFVRGAVYLYDGEIVEGKAPVATGMTLEKDVYKDYMKGAKDKDNYTEIENGVSYTEDGSSYTCFSVDDKAYFLITTEQIVDEGLAVDRIKVELEK